MTETVVDTFRRVVKENPDRVALKTLEAGGGEVINWTWSEVEDRVDVVAKGLHELGLGYQDGLALMLINRPEFFICDVAGMVLGAATTSIYQTLAPEQIVYVLNDAETKVMITEQVFLPIIQSVRDQVPSLEHVIVIDGEAPEGVLSLAEVEERGKGSDVDLATAAEQITPDTVITLIYTSGTTGDPKGVEMTHGNITAAWASAAGRIVLPPGSRVISWLPAAHIAERMAHHYMPIGFALETTYCPDPRRIGEYLPQVRPTWFFAVPRVWEKMRSALRAGLDAMPGEQGEQARAALNASIQKVRLEQSGQEVPAELAAAVQQADAVLFSALREKIGLDQLTTCNVGASPTPPEVIEFFHAIGVPLSELWGMSETAGCGANNPPEDIRIGTIGTAAPGCELKVAEDGELLIRGGVVMPKYRNKPDKTAEALDEDGWLHTGDVATIDDDGYVTLIDRKKELIINAMGKNMSPAHIESRLKAASPLIGQAVAIGDNRAYNTALIVLDPEAAPVWAAQNGKEGASLDELASDAKLIGEIDAAVQAANERLARVEQIKKFTVLSEEWMPSGDELTPTMKLKRKPISQKYADRIDAMYT